MIQNVTIGQYFPGNSFMHRLDARLKLVFGHYPHCTDFLYSFSMGIYFGDGTVAVYDNLQQGFV